MRPSQPCCPCGLARNPCRWMAPSGASLRSPLSVVFAPVLHPLSPPSSSLPFLLFATHPRRSLMQERIPSLAVFQQPAPLPGTSWVCPTRQHPATPHPGPRERPKRSRNAFWCPRMGNRGGGGWAGGRRGCAHARGGGGRGMGSAVGPEGRRRGGEATGGECETQVMGRHGSIDDM